jgi:hypothetical protein
MTARNKEVVKRIAHKIVELDSSQDFDSAYSQFMKTAAKSKDWAAKFCQEFERHEDHLVVLYYIPDLDAYNIAWTKGSPVKTRTAEKET